MAKPKYMAQYGECVLCKELRLLDYHHIIPQSMKVNTNRKPMLFYSVGNNKVVKINNVGKDVRIEGIMIMICKSCHSRLHNEFKKYKGV